MCEFYQLIFKQKCTNIKSLNQLIYPSSKTFFNLDDDTTLLEKIIIYYEEKTLVEEMILDKNLQYQIQ